MKFWFLLLLLVIGVQFSGLSQEVVLINGKKYILHQIEEGESIESICKRYSISKKELKRANRQINYSFSEGDMLKIPVAKRNKNQDKRSEANESAGGSEHVVAAGETFYSISKAREVPLAALLAANPQFAAGIKPLDVIKIPQEWDAAVNVPDREDEYFIYHRVGQGETLYNISQSYNCDIARIKELNQLANDSLTLGTELRIPKGTQLLPEMNEGDGVFEYLVVTGDTYFRLKQEYNVSEAELAELNPSLKEGLKAGMRIQIPNRVKERFEVKIDTTANWLKHRVVADETLYGLAKRYDVEIPLLKKNNPNLKLRGPIIGEELLIKSELDSVISPIDSLVVPAIVIDQLVEHDEELLALNDSDRVQIGLLLPLFLKKNDEINTEPIPQEELDSLRAADPLYPDSTRTKKNKQIYGGTKNFLHFYEGVLLAMKQQADPRIELKLFDTDKSGLAVDTLVRGGYLDSINLFVGPVYGRTQKPVLEYAKTKSIPMVSPLSSSDLLTKSYANMLQINPPVDYQLQKTVEMMADKYFDKNVVIMEMDSLTAKEQKAVNLLREKLFTTGYYLQDSTIIYREFNYKKQGFNGLRMMLRNDVENVIYIPSSSQAQISIAINSLSSLTDEFNITLVGRSSYPRYANIELEAFHKLKLNFLTPYNVDYSTENVNQFIAAYRSEFHEEPDQFSFQGYDIVTFISRMLKRYGTDFVSKLNEIPVQNLTQSNYSFRKMNETGGWINQTFFEIEYKSDYTIETVEQLNESY